MIVGFPGETYEEFRDNRFPCGGGRLHVAFYVYLFAPCGHARGVSAGPGAAREKVRWFQELTQAQERAAAVRCAAAVGSTERVLVESRNARNGRLEGRTGGNVIVELDGPDAWIGQFREVRITQARNWILRGVPKEDA